MAQTLYNTMVDLGKQLYTATQALLIQKGLKANSDVVKSVEVQVQPTFISLLSVDYLEYISTGRKPGGKKVPIKYILEFIKQNNLKGRAQSQQAVAFAIATAIAKRRGSSKRPPTSSLLDWMNFNGITGKPMSDNELAFAIQTSIWKSGIRGKNFYDALTKMYQDMGATKISTDVEKMIETSIDNIKLN